MSHAPTDALRRRHQAVRDASSALRLDALIVTALPNILYLTNFTGSTAISVLTADRVYFLTDFRYVTEVTDTHGAAHECPDLELVTVDGSYVVNESSTEYGKPNFNANLAYQSRMMQLGFKVSF